MAFRNEVLDQRNPKLPLQPEDGLKFINFLIERATDAIFCVAPDAQFLYLNDAACCLVGYSREELLSMTMHDVDPNFSPEVWSRHWRNLKQWGSLYFECFHRGEEGWSFPLDITLTYLECYGREYGCIFVRDIIKRKPIEVTLNRNNEALETKVQEYTALLRDANEQLGNEIAERKRTEAELEKSSSLLQTILESTADGVIAISCKGDIINFNQKFVEMWQVPESIMSSKNHSQWLAFYRNQLKDPEVFCRCIQELDSQADVESSEILELKDGRVFERYSHPQQLGEQIIGRLWSFRDITERKRMEEELRQSEAKFRTLAETTDAIIFIIQGTQFCYVNSVAETVIGYKKEELLTHPNFCKQLQLKKCDSVHKQCASSPPQYEEVK
ncbi:MAG: PAS domain S-box protein, partial [Tolypothrix sp. T3-bin4]|nr:PAS domain S-box protein [Tolypothrix sp. T3-bin4]